MLNLGELETNGFEVTLNYAAISTQNFSWDVGVNLATFKVNLINISDQEEFVTYTGNYYIYLFILRLIDEFTIG